ncbi:MAG: hypothetical protein K1X64_02975 [Myxococcaceae bacterium]|nr:hypothetical protein [Myxococcaceae bacterium]
MISAAAFAVVSLLNAAPGKADVRAEKPNPPAYVTGVVTSSFPMIPLIENQKMPYQSGDMAPVDLDLTRQSATTDDGFYLQISVPMAAMSQPAVMKNVKAEDQAAALQTAYSELLKMLSERAARSVNGKITERKALNLPFGRGVALSGPMFEDGVPSAIGQFLVHAVITDAPEIQVILGTSRNDKLSQDKMQDFVRSLNFSPSTAVKLNR